LFNYITVFEPYSNSKNSPLAPQKVIKDPKIRSDSKVRIERNIENESLNPSPTPKIAC